MIALVGEERRNACSGIGSIVIGELREGEKRSPVVLLVVAVGANVLLEGLIDAFRLSITLWMISGGEVQFHAKSSSEGAEEPGGKLRAAVASDVRWNSVLGKDMSDEEFCKLDSGNGVVRRKEYALFR